MCFVGFTVFLLLLVWYFQIAHLNSFYKNIKRKELKNAAEELLDYVDSSELARAVIRIADVYDITINIVDSSGLSVCQSHLTENSHISIYRPERYKELRNMVYDNGGTFMFEVGGKYREDNFQTMRPEDGKIPEGEFRPDEGLITHFKEVDNAISMVYLRLVTDSDGQENMIMMNSLITPVDATVNTLRIQFIYITSIFIVLALIVAIILARTIARPIEKINDSAKKLADGDFEPRFEAKGYREVCELSDTLNYAAVELGKTERLQRELLANVSHDLRTPLTMITAYSEVMRDLPGENTPENAQVIIDESKRLTTLVNDMLDLSKLQAGAASFKREVFDFTASILKVMKRFSQFTKQQGYNIIFEYDDDVKVCADEYKVYQVIYNLINNAINYAGEDKEVVVRQILKGDSVRLEVTDHGAGIAEDELANIWDRYYKVDKTHKRAVQGSGIGLSIVKNIMKLHNGRYGVESKPGEGSTFWFELDIAHEADETESK